MDFSLGISSSSTMICLPGNTILIITELPDIGFGMFDGKNS